jgi:phage baseplate assembly protein W
MFNIPAKRGLAYPLTLSNGGLWLSEDAELKRDAVISVLQTRPYERVMRPAYGTPDYVFEAPPSAAVVASQIQMALDNQVTGCTFAVEAEAADSGDFTLSIQYQVNGVEQPLIQYRLAS